MKINNLDAKAVYEMGEAAQKPIIEFHSALAGLVLLLDPDGNDQSRQALLGHNAGADERQRWIAAFVALIYRECGNTIDGLSDLIYLAEKALNDSKPPSDK